MSSLPASAELVTVWQEHPAFPLSVLLQLILESKSEHHSIF